MQVVQFMQKVCNNIAVGDQVSKIDRVGMVASFACAIHCMVMPVFATLVAARGLFSEHSIWIDYAFFAVAAMVGPLAIWIGYRRHRSWIPSLVYVLGVLLVATSVFGLHHHSAPPSSNSDGLLAAIVSAVGGFTLVGFHVMNSRFQRKICCDNPLCSHSVEELRS